VKKTRQRNDPEYFRDSKKSENTRVAVRIAALIIGALGAALWLWLAKVTFLSGSDAATKGLDNVAGLAVTALFAVTVLPALILAWRGQRLRLALGLSLAFPLILIAAVAAIALSLP
jgi:hypothetical protein